MGEGVGKVTVCFGKRLGGVRRKGIVEKGIGGRVARICFGGSEEENRVVYVGGVFDGRQSDDGGSLNAGDG
jgi:hypothetical protein